MINNTIVYNLENTSNNSSDSFLEELPIRLRGRAEWWELKRADIILINQIGEGSVGVVYKTLWRGLDTACKFLKKSATETDLNDLQNEVDIISHLRHPNLVLFLGACTNDPLLLLYEYLPLGSLDNYYKTQSNIIKKLWKPNNNLIYKWNHELSQAIYFLHSCHYPIMHRDIKPSNILLTNDLHIKITDFGLSKTIKKKHDYYKMSGCVGTLRYMAPEVINNKDYDLKIDIYSLSLIFWFIYTGLLPYENIIDNKDMPIHIINGLRPDHTLIKCKKLQILIINMWNEEPELRPNMKSVLNSIENLEFKKEKSCIII
tara:strand:- start:1920 stop:2867 length:948 start_codon:yes stop_codon:yes gene_type:complete